MLAQTNQVPPLLAETNEVNTFASQEDQSSQELIFAPPAEEEKTEENVGEVSKVDALQDAAAPKVTVVPVAQKISASISASLSSVRDTLNKTLFNPDIIKSIGEKIPFKTVLVSIIGDIYVIQGIYKGDI